jgi:hypothetical protein
MPVIEELYLDTLSSVAMRWTDREPGLIKISTLAGAVLALRRFQTPCDAIIWTT